MVKVDKRKKIDVLLIAEGTYPYIRGGVSSWIHDLISNISEYSFGIIFLGSRPEDYGDIKYKLPENLVYLHVEYLFKDTERPKPKEIEGNKKAFEIVRDLIYWFKQKRHEYIPKEVLNADFYEKKVTYEDFLYSRGSWDLITEFYVKYAIGTPFIDYFWTIRNMHYPIWVLARIVKKIGDRFNIIHSPSTGYAGFLASLLKSYYKKPFILTEHGIYVKERKIDILNADWFTTEIFKVIKAVGEKDHIQELWTNFFFGLGRLIYHSADKIISLFNNAREAQISLGADPEKCIVLPNGVDTKGLSHIVEERGEKPPKVIGLIGRVVPIKDIKTFIKAMKLTVEKLPEVQGWIVGPTDEDPEYYEECKNLVEALNLNDKVLFLGFQNIREIMPKIGLLTLTSISEGMPLVVLEGFAAGLPCVATDVGSCRQLIYGGLNQEDIAIGKAGEVVPIANPSELAKAYVKVLSNENLWKQYQQNALKRVNTFYTKEIFLDNYRKLYAEAKTWRV
ncbi:MAG: GT4 family glycosyltransferase PelF [Aquificaceae bacterium]